MLNFDNYYINQTASYVKNLTFKNNTTVGTYGCGVCCFAMIVCWDQGITSESGKASSCKTNYSQCNKLQWRFDL